MEPLHEVPLAVTLLFANSASAQNITIQQPILSVNSVATTVSAPDRGSACRGLL